MGENDAYIEYIAIINSMSPDERRRLILNGKPVDPSFYGVDYGNPFRPPDPSYYEYNRVMMGLRASRNPAYPSDFNSPIKLVCAHCGTRNASDWDRCKACGAPLVLEERHPSGVCRVESHEENEDGTPVEEMSFQEFLENALHKDTPLPTLDKATESFEDKLIYFFLILSVVAVIATALIGLFSR